MGKYVTVYCYGTTKLYFNENEISEDAESEDTKSIHAIRCKDGYDWVYETDIPHKEFDILDEDDYLYCRGIIFKAADLKRV